MESERFLQIRGCRCCINNVSKSATPTTTSIYSKISIMKVIVSLVVVAALGGFGAINVVQSFLPVQVPSCAPSVALTSVAGFGRLVNDVNNVRVATKYVVPYSAYCNGDNVSCGLAMGRCAAAAATTAQGHALGANVAFRSACARFPTFLSASSSPEDDPKPLESVWVQLYVDGEKAGRATQVELDLGSNVDNLATAVKQVYSNKLAGVDAAELNVYTWDDVKFTETLDPGAIVTDAFGGTSSKTAFIVAAGNIQPCKMEM
jgi:hypothetical protein